MHKTDKLKLGQREWLLLRRVLNEVANGINIENHQSLIGLSRADLRHWLSTLRELNPETDISLDAAQVAVFYNALRETIRRLPGEEFHIRTDYLTAEANEILERLNSWVGGHG
jgi:hypothetical protein